jgi:hypothetical protein
MPAPCILSRGTGLGLVLQRTPIALMSQLVVTLRPFTVGVNLVHYKLIRGE